MIFKAKLLKNPKVIKDYFSIQSKQYSQYRPNYPDKLYRYLLSECRDRKLAWDAGTGNGQAAKELSIYFEQVCATDISGSQILNSFSESNITYKVSNEQVPSLKKRSVDLITVAQSLHWFDTEIFYSEAKRILKRYGLIACWCYGGFSIDEKLNQEINWIYSDFLKGFWPPERRLVETGYRTLSFPFRELRVPKFEIKLVWSFKNMIGYISSLSAVVNFKNRKGYDPISKNLKRLKLAWGDLEEVKEVKWSISLRAGHLL